MFEVQIFWCRLGLPHPSLYSLGGGIRDRIPIGLHVAFLVCYKEIYYMETVSRYILLCLVLETSRFVWPPYASSLVVSSIVDRHGSNIHAVKVPRLGPYI